MYLSDVLNAATAHLSGYAVAKKLGISSQAFYQFKNGKRIPSEKILDQLAIITGLNPVDVYLAAYAEKLDNTDIANKLRSLKTH
ncbi:helix-turn-helix transcriptional regulator [uncultured Pseudoalteromonas sp.]|uniref:helix-turn-helix domain-containing protein n=1 Tax=uncultured Pseudoalteromonas sp. TaxID=114053 RepID=UPI0030F762BC